MLTLPSAILIAYQAQLTLLKSELDRSLEAKGKELADLKGYIAALEEQKADLTTENQQLKSQIAENQTQIGGLQSRAEQLQSELSSTKQQKVGFIHTSLLCFRARLAHVFLTSLCQNFDVIYVFL